MWFLQEQCHIARICAIYIWGWRGAGQSLSIVLILQRCPDGWIIRFAQVRLPDTLHCGQRSERWLNTGPESQQQFKVSKKNASNSSAHGAFTESKICRRKAPQALAAFEMIFLIKWVWRRKFQYTLVFLPGEFQGQRSLEGYMQSMGSTKSWTWLSD